MLLLDLATVARHERADAFQYALDLSVPNDVEHEDPDAELRARFDMWRVGAVDLVEVHSTGFQVRRTEKHLRRLRERPVVSVSLQTGGTGRVELGGRQQLLGPDDISVQHEVCARTYGWSGSGASQALLIDAERLGLPVESVVEAGFRLRASPMYDLVLGHLRGLWRDPALMEADPGASALSDATVGLVRALLVSAAHDPGDPPVGAAMDDTLLTRILAYLRRHSTEPDLTPERVAVEHAISRRHLYAVLGRAGISLEQWLIEERLERARALLASPAYRGLTVAAVAARCGFGSASHFTRRFRAAYGLTPREWRRHAETEAAAKASLLRSGTARPRVPAPDVSSADDRGAVPTPDGDPLPGEPGIG
ncbi:helix-turn-helix domain-containing protein [Streptomyces sp. NPDC046978]|uniref:helix-turn-helix domain-containing protein n=1 Tax=unclassified Streptomyces TaxID=2593676 RepID=UPI0033E5FA0F